MENESNSKKWKTHLVLHFGTKNNKKPSEIAEDLKKIGFESSLGTVDFVYDWQEKQPSKE